MMKLFTILSLATSILAQSDTCPNGVGPSTVNGVTACCPALLTSDNTGTYCIIGCNAGFASCFPFCNGQPSITSSGTCTSVYVTASDYSSIVYGGNAATGTTGNSVATTSSSVVQSSSASTNTLTSTNASPSVMASGTAPTSIASSQASAATQQVSPTAAAPSSTSLSRGAGAMVTAAPMLIVGALAGIVFA